MVFFTVDVLLSLEVFPCAIRLSEMTIESKLDDFSQMKYTQKPGGMSPSDVTVFMLVSRDGNEKSCQVGSSSTRQDLG
jgi:hypothetical protein